MHFLTSSLSSFEAVAVADAVQGSRLLLLLTCIGAHVSVEIEIGKE